MDQNSVSFRQGIPFYMGIASIATGLFLLSASSWYNTLTAIIAFIAAGLILYLGWLTHMGMDDRCRIMVTVNGQTERCGMHM
jgi:hypothetical protein